MRKGWLGAIGLHHYPLMTDAKDFPMECDLWCIE